MDSIINKIEQRVQSLGRASIIFPDDFIDLGSNEAIRQDLTSEPFVEFIETKKKRYFRQ